MVQPSKEDLQEKIIEALKKVPEKKLLIIELANSIPVSKGMFDPAEKTKRQLEINLAEIEAKSYGSHTIMAVEQLMRIKGKEEGPQNVGH